MLLERARNWTYLAATLDGRPVRYLKRLEIVLAEK
jgi:hypothetical protein